MPLFDKEKTFFDYILFVFSMLVVVLFVFLFAENIYDENAKKDDVSTIVNGIEKEISSEEDGLQSLTDTFKKNDYTKFGEHLSHDGKYENIVSIENILSDIQPSHDSKITVKKISLAENAKIVSLSCFPKTTTLVEFPENVKITRWPSFYLSSKGKKFDEKFLGSQLLIDQISNNIAIIHFPKKEMTVPINVMINFSEKEFPLTFIVHSAYKNESPEYHVRFVLE